jgi:hypothetical protein
LSASSRASKKSSLVNHYKRPLPNTTNHHQPLPTTTDHASPPPTLSRRLSRLPTTPRHYRPLPTLSSPPISTSKQFPLPFLARNHCQKIKQLINPIVVNAKRIALLSNRKKNQSIISITYRRKMMERIVHDLFKALNYEAATIAIVATKDALRLWLRYLRDIGSLLRALPLLRRNVHNNVTTMQKWQWYMMKWQWYMMKWQWYIIMSLQCRNGNCRLTYAICQLQIDIRHKDLW